MERSRFIAHGRVQGVFFRAAINDLARGFKVTGFVKNLADGTVEIVAEGEPGELRRFAAACKINDGMRRVDKLDEQYAEVKERHYASFSIAY